MLLLYLLEICCFTYFKKVSMWRRLLPFLVVLPLVLTSCSTTITQRPKPTPTPIFYQLAVAYSGTLTSAETNQTENLTLTNIQETSDGNFTSTLLVGGNGGLTYLARGFVHRQPDRTIAFTVLNTQVFWIFSGTIASDGSMQGQVQLSNDDSKESAWALAPQS